MSQHANPIRLRDEFVDKDDPDLEDGVICNGCRWQGPVGDLMADADDRDPQLRCPICGSPGWVWD